MAQASHVVTLICIAMLREKTDIAFCTSYEDETSADGEQHQAYKNISELEGIAPKGCQTTCVKRSMKYLQLQNLANVVKKQPLLDLQRLQRNHPSAVLLQTRVCSRGRTCLSAGTCHVSLASL